MRKADLFRQFVTTGAMLLVVLGVGGCASKAGSDNRTAEPQAVSSAQSTYPATPFPRIETGTHVAAVSRIDVDAAERFLVPGSRDKTVRVWELATGALLQTLRVPIDEGAVGKIYANF